MFGFLKKKLENFSEKLKKNVELKEKPTKDEEEIKEIPPTKKQVNKKEIYKKNKELNKKEIKKTNFQIEKNKPKTQLDSIKEKKTNNNLNENFIEKEIKIAQIKKKTYFENDLNENTKQESKEKIIVKKVDEDKRELKAKIGTSGKIKSFFTKQIEINENEIQDLLFELELSLLESDVEQDTAKEIIEQIKKRIIGKKISTKNINDYLKDSIKEILKEMMETKTIDLIKEIKESQKPYKILVLGPNGAGKTTSIAKITYLLQKHNLSCVWAASDTFRSGAIDQLNEHAEKLNVKVIKQQYGADPAAVAYDALQSANANKNDVILIDTAGRQETNKNLMEELKKIERVIKPNLKIYVGEAYTGQGLLEMAKDFNEKVGIDAFILTKIDADAKGGTTISLLYKLKKPILFVGTGQEYSNLENFTPEFILNRII
ncbi:MAG: signal recognition particle-docking protein FtsY [Candidatus ainarchaeum sp.]|nr:signal recognition particle-docking protein FtsY [Candidatus ainarchaeum sp.]